MSGFAIEMLMIDVFLLTLIVVYNNENNNDNNKIC